MGNRSNRKHTQKERTTMSVPTIILFAIAYIGIIAVGVIMINDGYRKDWDKK